MLGGECVCVLGGVCVYRMSTCVLGGEYVLMGRECVCAGSVSVCVCMCVCVCVCVCIFFRFFPIEDYYYKIWSRVLCATRSWFILRIVVCVC